MKGSVCNTHVFTNLYTCSPSGLVQRIVVFRKCRDLGLTLWSETLLKKLMVSWLIMKFCAFYGTQR